MVRVVFLHPDLGIGGAERLVVDAAVSLKSKGCSVQIWTAHYDPTHCFSETLDPELPVVLKHTSLHNILPQRCTTKTIYIIKLFLFFLNQVCVGDWLPTSVFGYLHALCAYLRMIYVALYLVFFSGVEYDVIFCDQVSCVIQELTTCRCLLSHHSFRFLRAVCISFLPRLLR